MLYRPMPKGVMQHSRSLIALLTIAPLPGRIRTEATHVGRRDHPSRSDEPSTLHPAARSKSFLSTIADPHSSRRMPGLSGDARPTPHRLHHLFND
jgi:hypothetical protein